MKSRYLQQSDAVGFFGNDRRASCEVRLFLLSTSPPAEASGLSDGFGRVYLRRLTITNVT